MIKLFKKIASLFRSIYGILLCLPEHYHHHLANFPEEMTLERKEALALQGLLLTTRRI